MAAPRRSRSLRNIGTPLAAAARPSPRPRGAGEPELDADSELDGDSVLDGCSVCDGDPELELECSSWLSVESDEEKGGSAPWPGQPGQRSAAAALLERCVAAGAVSQVPPAPRGLRRAGASLTPSSRESCSIAERGRGATALNY